MRKVTRLAKLGEGFGLICEEFQLTLITWGLRSSTRVALRN